MRATLLAPILPRVMEEGESKKAALILMKNSHFDRTLRYTFIDLLSFHIKLSTTKWIIRGQKSQVFCPSCMIPISTQKEQAWKRLKNEIKILTGGQRPTQYVLNKRWCPIGDMSIEHSTMQTKCEIFTSLRNLVFLLLYHSKSSGFFFWKWPYLLALKTWILLSFFQNAVIVSLFKIILEETAWFACFWNALGLWAAPTTPHP